MRLHEQADLPRRGDHLIALVELADHPVVTECHALGAALRADFAHGSEAAVVSRRHLLDVIYERLATQQLGAWAGAAKIIFDQGNSVTLLARIQNGRKRHRTWKAWLRLRDACAGHQQRQEG